MIKHLGLEIARLRREQFGHSSERRARLIDRMELQLEELEAAATGDEIAAGKATRTTPVAGFERRRPARKPFPGAPAARAVVVSAMGIGLQDALPAREGPVGMGHLAVPRDVE